jgi:two-component system, LytTR family, sensor histidine kinase AlgZ
MNEFWARWLKWRKRSALGAGHGKRRRADAHRARGHRPDQPLGDERGAGAHSTQAQRPLAPSVGAQKVDAKAPLAAGPASQLPQDSLFSASLAREESLWPETTLHPSLDSASYAMSRFDPLSEERARLQTQAMAAFDVCHPALALRAVVLVQAALATVALVTAQGGADWAARTAALAFGGLLATLIWLVTVCALRPLLTRRSATQRATVVLLLGAVSAALSWAPLAWAGMAPKDVFTVAGLLAAGLGLAALVWAWLDVRSRIWHPAMASARLAELQSRIRPHFLFNALNSALALVRVEPARAEAVLEDLAQLFRVALAEAGASVSLQEEMDLARRYLAIEQVRFGQRLVLQWHVDPQVFATRVPPLVLQPLVENAVRHGVEPSVDGGHITISAKLQLGQVVVLVTNTLSDDAGSPGHGMALHNLRERLRLLHDVSAQCDVWHEPPAKGYDGGGLFHARITLPAP